VKGSAAQNGEGEGANLSAILNQNDIFYEFNESGKKELVKNYEKGINNLELSDIQFEARSSITKFNAKESVGPSHQLL
jgi:hypothetical protein